MILSGRRFIVEAGVLEDWAAVAKAVDDRVRELGMRQRELAERSHVSQAIVREIQHCTVERHRSARTLEALSVALEWHPGHLAAILHGRTPLDPGQSGDPVMDCMATRLAAIEQQLNGITSRLAAIDARLPVSAPVAVDGQVRVGWL